jgi:acyl carrier protein
MSEKVIKVVSETLGVHIDRITAQSHLVDDLGADDFDTVEVVIAIEKALGVKIADEDAEKIVTVQDIIKLVK